MSQNTALKRLGLTSNESNVYMYLLDVQTEQSAKDIIDALSFDKVTVYRALKSLEEQRLIEIFGKTRNQTFKASPSKQLFTKYNEKMSELADIRNQLEELVQSAASKRHEFYRSNKISVYSGLSGFRSWNERRLESGIKDIYEFSSGRIFKGLFSDEHEEVAYMEGYIKRRLEKNISMYSLMSSHTQRKNYDTTDDKRLKQQKIIKLEDDADGFMSVFGNCFGFYTKQSDQYLGIIIEDPILSKMMLLTFKSLWNQGDEV